MGESPWSKETNVAGHYTIIGSTKFELQFHYVCSFSDNIPLGKVLNSLIPHLWVK